MNIALPESLELLVRKRVEERGYASAEEYVRDLILSDEEWRAPDGHILTGTERQDIEMIDLRLVKSIASGPSMRRIGKPRNSDCASGGRMGPKITITPEADRELDPCSVRVVPAH